MDYEEKVYEIHKLARDAEDPDERGALEQALLAAQYFRRCDAPKAHKILDRALGGD